MNRVWQEQLDKAGANPRDDYLISSSGLAAQLGEAGVKVLDATTHLRPTEDGGFSSEPGFDDFCQNIFLAHSLRICREPSRCRIFLSFHGPFSRSVCS